MGEEGNLGADKSDGSIFFSFSMPKIFHKAIQIFLRHIIPSPAMALFLHFSVLLLRFRLVYKILNFVFFMNGNKLN